MKHTLVPGHTGEITLPNGFSLQELISDCICLFKHVSHNNDIPVVTHQESDYDGATETPHMSRKHNVIKQKTKTQLAFNISQREIKELYCPVSSDESQIKEVSIDLFEHFDFSPEKF